MYLHTNTLRCTQQRDRVPLIPALRRGRQKQGLLYTFEPAWSTQQVLGSQSYIVRLETKQNKVNIHLTEKYLLRHRVQSKNSIKLFSPMSAMRSLLWHCNNAAPRGRNIEERHIYMSVMNFLKPGKTEVVTFFSLLG